ncbi:citryl-CoA lyase [Inmirania thermothiophila]|uniref:Citrate synthase n=1 Tax=Inmirania thermothiophila TaxID=1750597 RepID=A0A3N1Y0I2_9GAMM|nr:citryl-CoA lyase [Inmirania thermothiophila]ROR32018.1 citrate synthase [Inmirania thermothiophila]
MELPRDVIRSRIWEEEPEADNEFAARACYCRGFDVYGELLTKAGFIEYLFLLFAGDPPTAAQARLLDRLALALANPGPREPSVNAAMAAGAGGSSAASALMAALAVGAGGLGGGREVWWAVRGWHACGTDLEAWVCWLREPPVEPRADVWPAPEHPVGFDPNGASCAEPVRRTLDALAATGAGERLAWLRAQRPVLEAAVGCPLAMSGVAAAAYADLGLSPEQAEMLHLLLRLPGAAVHALEQQGLGWRRYPFFAEGLELLDDPGGAGEGAP